ncbi:DNA cytosine methyltransferase [Asaia sp. BMEF1]|uniref:DNA cytosine methyltransferase n=1 Tax=Asaia sp. BMEF1 TaxID=3155932 RepID=UPI003F673E06
MPVLYNEWDEPTAAWLRELIDGRHLPSGSVDTRSIGDVRADDLRDFDQCHFFAGIGGWPLALRWAGLEGTPGIWTGSPPCQPFSVAGKGLGQADERHLAPVWLDLIRECKPGLIFGEQVADAIGKGWLDDLFDALEREGYACGAAVLPACSVGAPHIRKRLFFGAVRLADANEDRFATGRERRSVRSEHDTGHGGATCWLAGAYSIGSNRSGPLRESGRSEYPERGDAGWLADPDDTRPQGRAGMPERADEQPARTGSVEGRPANPHHGFWSGADWLGCRDGKFRPVGPGTQPLAHGLSARVGRLRGYGNAIVPQVAAQFITEFLGAIADMQDEGLTP